MNTCPLARVNPRQLNIGGTLSPRMRKRADSDWTSGRISERLVKHWNRMPRKVVEFTPLEMLKKQLEIVFSSMVSLTGWYLVKGWTRWPWKNFPKVMILWYLSNNYGLIEGGWMQKWYWDFSEILEKNLDFSTAHVKLSWTFPKTGF